MKITGITILRNAVKLDYPFGLAVRSLCLFCDEVVALVDPTCDGDTSTRIHEAALNAALDGGAQTWKIVYSVWDTANHDGHKNCEISVQTAKACEAATGDWILSLQADEVLHEQEIAPLRRVVESADQKGLTAVELERLYFYGDLEHIRQDWTLWMVRLFKRGHWRPDVDGAMRFDPCGEKERRLRTEVAKIYHYSRIGDPRLIAERVRNLDRFFHPAERVQTGDLPPYSFDLRKLDTYIVGHEPEEDKDARLEHFPLDRHPAMAREFFGADHS